MTTKTHTTQLEGTVDVCCPSVTFRYGDFEHELTPELEEELTDHAEDHAKECLVEGYHSGDLNCCYHTQQDVSNEEEIRGGWEIVRA